MSQDEPVIRIRGLRNQFGSQIVHENLDLDVYRGNIIGVVGGSGSGKSVLLRSIIGLGHPAAGSIKLFGEEVSTLTDARRAMIERRCGVLFQNGALFSSLTVAENVAVALTEHHDLDPQWVLHLSKLKISLAGLPLSSADKYPAQLSGGMVKRAALARSLALDPDILFLDEPTAGLDPIGAAAFDQLILTLPEKRILVADSLDVVENNSNEWIQEYFQGPRGRAAQRASANHANQPAGH
jgi:phospholipid/cholesterol/gamma-HCH transport system ATP-binding protein